MKRLAALSVRTLEAHHRQHNMLVFLCLRTAVKIFKSLSMHSLVLLAIRMHDKVCDEVSLWQCVPINRQSWTHAPSANAAEKLREDHIQDGSSHLPQRGENPEGCNTALVTALNFKFAGQILL